ncbi:hypothetical protein QR685DRAFT_546711 [Neurospora intermedia]|uniref:Uncharacterized protein n=1 Tax=Neurospora intermedia TaxID=5142 RepID=A0ABR3D895_NEUIN
MYISVGKGGVTVKVTSEGAPSVWYRKKTDETFQAAALIRYKLHVFRPTLGCPLKSTQTTVARDWAGSHEGSCSVVCPGVGGERLWRFLFFSSGRTPGMLPYQFRPRSCIDAVSRCTLQRTRMNVGRKKMVKFSAVCITRKCSDGPPYSAPPPPPKPGTRYRGPCLLHQGLGPGASSRWLHICSTDCHDDDAGGDEEQQPNTPIPDPDLTPRSQA